MKMVEKFRKIEALATKFTFWLAAVAVIGMMVMMLVTFFDVALRKTTGGVINGASEYASFGLCLLVMCGMGYCEMRRGHVQVTMFLRLMPEKLAFICLTIVNILGTITAFTLSYALLMQAIKLTGSSVQGVLTHIPYYPFYYICFVGILAFAFAHLFTTIRSLLALGSEEIAKDITKDWQ